MGTRVKIEERLDDREIGEVLGVVDAAAEADGVRPLNEQAMLQLRHGGEGARSLLLYDGSTLVGYAHVEQADPDEGPSGELVVHPAHRRLGHGGRLLRSALELTGGRLRLWAHGDHDGAGALAASLGFERTRSLWQMRRPLSAELPSAEPPSGVRLRAFVPGQDEEAWLKVNSAAFAHHPEQGAWTMDDLLRREAEPWFDPAGFFLAVRDARLVGFHWTKVHGSPDSLGSPGSLDSPGSPGSLGSLGSLGEVYVVGVDPSQQGTGLGRALTLAGLHHLRARGLAQVMLYVDEANAAAVRLYTGLGFSRWDVDVMYSITPRSGGAPSTR
jgi:mycothiol synthase